MLLPHGVQVFLSTFWIWGLNSCAWVLASALYVSSCCCSGYQFLFRLMSHLPVPLGHSWHHRASRMALAIRVQALQLQLSQDLVVKLPGKFLSWQCIFSWILAPSVLPNIAEPGRNSFVIFLSRQSLGQCLKPGARGVSLLLQLRARRFSANDFYTVLAACVPAACVPAASSLTG